MSVSSYHPLEGSIQSSLEKPSRNDPPATRSGLKAWARAVWPLFLHSIIAILISITLIFFVDHEHFGLTDRKPVVPLPNRQSVTSSRYMPLQSDVVTALSASIVLLRWVLAAWSTPFCWRSALFLMGRRGLTRWELKLILHSETFAPNLFHPGRRIALLVGITLLFNLVASSLSPLLTGSISWLPSNRPYHMNGSEGYQGVNASYIDPNNNLWHRYMGDIIFRRSILQKALGSATLAWGRDLDSGVVKRTIPSAEGLQINSTLINITLPFFAVQGIQWSETIPQNSTAADRIFANVVDRINSGPLDRGDFWLDHGSAGIEPSENWSNDTERPFPSSIAVNQQRNLIIVLGGTVGSQRILFDKYPEFYDTRGYAYAYAQINYTAGVLQCSQCNISSPSTVQAISPIDFVPEQDPMTREALSLAPTVASALVTMNSSIPFPSNSTVDEYVTALLTRSYSAAWTALNERLGNPTISVTYYPTMPALQARVTRVRVYAWLGVQLSVTLSGILFIFMQTKSEASLLGDTTLTGFYLDTSSVPIGGRSPEFKQGGVLRLRSKGDRLKVEVQDDK